MTNTNYDAEKNKIVYVQVTLEQLSHLYMLTLQDIGQKSRENFDIGFEAGLKARLRHSLDKALTSL